MTTIKRLMASYLINIVEQMRLQNRCCNPGETWDYVKRVLRVEPDPKVFWEYI